MRVDRMSGLRGPTRRRLPAWGPLPFRPRRSRPLSHPRLPPPHRPLRRFARHVRAIPGNNGSLGAAGAQPSGHRPRHRRVRRVPPDPSARGPQRRAHALRALADERSMRLRGGVQIRARGTGERRGARLCCLSSRLLSRQSRPRRDFRHISHTTLGPHKLALAASAPPFSHRHGTRGSVSRAAINSLLCRHSSDRATQSSVPSPIPASAVRGSPRSRRTVRVASFLFFAELSHHRLTK
mmetsp:Transcript_47059/g.145105  ORF Transcript_47059/g.145105 Transcript_47059/m.145105 type:complete len:238 (+) Transcript_47059:318-1031(+)